MDILRCVPYSINKSIRCILRKVNTPFTKKIQNIYKQLLDERLQVFSRGEPTQNLNFIFHSSPPPNILEGSNFPGSPLYPSLSYLIILWLVLCSVHSMHYGCNLRNIFNSSQKRREYSPLLQLAFCKHAVKIITGCAL